MRYAVCGSAEVPEELLDEFRRVFGAPIGESYGLTEGGPVPIVNSRWGLKKRELCGLAFPGCDVSLVDEADRDVGVGRGGRAGHPQPGPGQGLLEAAGGDRRRSSAAAGSTPATSCAATPTATTTSSGAGTT